MKLEAIRAKIAKHPLGKAIRPYELDCLWFAKVHYMYVMGKQHLIP